MTETFTAEEWMVGNWGKPIQFETRAGGHPRDPDAAEPTVDLFVLSEPEQPWTIYHFEPDQARRLGVALIQLADKAG
jgi:hypothetical protein